jgi:hypothetical protein
MFLFAYRLYTTYEVWDKKKALGFAKAFLVFSQ